MINAIIVDDEIKSRQTLAGILKKYCTSVSVIDEAGNVAEAYSKINEMRPDLVFLDIAMPHEDGFGLLKRFDEISFTTIFTTAYEQHALKAIKACALDYLLKPLDISEVSGAVVRAAGEIAEKKRNLSMEQLIVNLRTTKSGHNKIAIPTRTGLDFISVEDIIRLEADNSYTHIFTVSGHPIVSTRNLKEYEDILPNGTFFRAHHSYIINISHICNYVRGEGGYVKMKDGSTVDIAKRKKAEFLALFEVSAPSR